MRVWVGRERGRQKEREGGCMGEGQKFESQEHSCHRRVRVEGAVMSEQRLDTHGSTGTFCPEPLGGTGASRFLLTWYLHYSEGCARTRQRAGSQSRHALRAGRNLRGLVPSIFLREEDPTFLQHLLCAGLTAGAPHEPHVDTSQQPAREG